MVCNYLENGTKEEPESPHIKKAEAPWYIRYFRRGAGAVSTKQWGETMRKSGVKCRHRVETKWNHKERGTRDPENTYHGIKEA